MVSRPPAAAAFARQVTVLVAISIIMTVGVYGLVAGIVKMDDAGLALMKSASSSARAFGRGLVAFAPKLMRFLSVAGTIAMFTVGGSIIAHGVPAIEHLVEGGVHAVGGGLAGTLVQTLLDAEAGVLARVAQHRHHQLIEHVRSPLDHVQVAEGERIEAAGVESLHRPILWTSPVGIRRF